MIKYFYAEEIKTYTAELFLKEKHTLGESLFYEERTKTQSWVDIREEKFWGKNRKITPVSFVGTLNC